MAYEVHLLHDNRGLRIPVLREQISWGFRQLKEAGQKAYQSKEEGNDRVKLPKVNQKPKLKSNISHGDPKRHKYVETCVVLLV
jgi:hypothetical protein